MSVLLNLPDFQTRSRNQIENFKLLDDLNKNDHLKHLILKMKNSIRLKLKINPLLKTQTDIRLRNLRLHTGFQNFFTDPPEIDRTHPP